MENSVSPANSELIGVEHIDNVAGGMARRVQHAAFERSDLDLAAFADGLVDIGDARGFVTRRDHPAFVLFLEFGNARGVIAMMMGDEDIRQLPAGRLQRGLDRGCFRRIDRGGRAGRRIMQQDAEIVGQAGEQMGLRRHVVPVLTNDA